MLRLVFLCTTLVVGANAAHAQSLPPLEVSMIKDTNTAPDEYGSNPGGFRRIDDRVYFYASTPATGRELFSTDGTPGGLRFEHDLTPGVRGTEPGPVVLGRLGDRLIVTAKYQLWAIGNGTAVALTPPTTFDTNTIVTQAIANVGGRLLMTRGSFNDTIWVTDGTPEGTHPQDGANGFALPKRAGGDCAIAAGAVYTTDTSPPYLVRNDGTVAGSAVIATMPSTAGGVPIAGRCYFVARTANGDSALWTSDGTAQGTAEVARIAGELPVSTVVMNGNLYVATRGANFRVRRYAPSDPAHPSVILDVPAVDGSLIATRSAVVAFVSGNNQSSVYLGSGGTTMHAIHTSPADGDSLLGWNYVQGDTVIVMTSPLATRIDASTGAITTIQSGRALTRSLAATLGDNIIGTGVDDQEVWISDGTDAGTRPLHTMWPDTANGISDYAPYEKPAVVGDVLIYNTAFGDARNALWRTDGTAQGTWALPSSALGGATPYAIAAVGDGLVVKARDATGLTHLYRTDAQLSGTSPAGTTYSSIADFVTNGDVALLECGGSLATMTLCALTPQAAAPVSIGGPPIADPWPYDDSIAAIGNIGGAAIFHVPSTNEIWRSDGTSPGTFRLSSGDGFRGASKNRPGSIVHAGKVYFAACRLPDDCSLHVTDGTIAGTAPVAPLGVSTGIVEARFERYGNEFVVGIASGFLGGIWRSDGTTAGTRRIMSGSFDRLAMAVVGDRIHFDVCCSYPWGLHVSDGTEAGTRPVPSVMAMIDTRLFENVDDAAVIFTCSMDGSNTTICAIDREGTGVQALGTLGTTGRGASVEFLARTSDTIYVIVDDYLHGREPWRIRVRDAIFANGFDAEP
jgi:ELWxxDGT repeat protein